MMIQPARNPMYPLYKRSDAGTCDVTESDSRDDATVTMVSVCSVLTLILLFLHSSSSISCLETSGKYATPNSFERHKVLVLF